MLYVIFFFMRRRPPRSTRTDTLFPYTTLFRSDAYVDHELAEDWLETVAKMDKKWAAFAQQEAAHFLRSEEHTSELQSLMRISYAVFCLKKKRKHNNTMYNIKLIS